MSGSELERLMETVIEVAEGHPGYTYTQVYIDEERGDGCVYVKNGEPSCIMGHALWRMGVIDDSFENDVLNTESISFVLDKLRIAGPESDDDRIVKALSWVQGRQDTGEPWGTAVEPLKVVQRGEELK